MCKCSIKIQVINRKDCLSLRHLTFLHSLSDLIFIREFLASYKYNIFSTITAINNAPYSLGVKIVIENEEYTKAYISSVNLVVRRWRVNPPLFLPPSPSPSHSPEPIPPSRTLKQQRPSLPSVFREIHSCFVPW